MHGPQKSRRRHSDGFIIVAVLWMLSGLAALALIYSGYLRDSTLALSVNDDRIASEALVSAGVELAAYRLLGAQREKRPARESFSARLPGAIIRVDFVTEAARIDLNAAPKEVLSGLFAVLGARAQEAGQYADRVVGWRTPPKQGVQDTEVPLYRAAGLSYSPRGAPFADASELWLVAGLPPALVDRAMPFVTVFSGRADVDALDAAPEVLAATLPPTQAGPSGLSNTGVAGALKNPDADGSAIGGGQPGAGAVRRSDAYRLLVRVALDNGWRTASEIVILLDGEDEPYHVLAWSDDVSSPQPGAALQR